MSEPMWAAGNQDHGDDAPGAGGPGGGAAPDGHQAGGGDQGPGGQGPGDQGPSDQGPGGPDPGTIPPGPPHAPVLDHASRHVPKATLVPLAIPLSPRADGRAVAKNAYVNQLGLRAGDVAAVRRFTAEQQTRSGAEVPWDLLARFESAPTPALAPGPAALADVPADGLRAFGAALAQLRRSELDGPAPGATQTLWIAGRDLPPTAGDALVQMNRAVIANKAFDAAVSATPIGMLNLERLEMAPAGIQRGELIATIPLAPGEETSVTQKEWSVVSKEFTSIVTDSLENVSETGVTDDTELAQSTTSQQQHANQFNITGTVSGGIPIISGSVTSGFTSQDSNSQSATDSRKHAVAVTRKASSRTRQEHKVTISTTTVAGTSETTTRSLKNPSATTPMRVDYFSMMRTWRVRLYRYGLRLTYDLVIPEPAGAMRKTYAELAWLRAQLGPFVFPVTHGEITDMVIPGDPQKPGFPAQPHYLVLADRYGAQVPHPPQPLAPWTRAETLPNAETHGAAGFSLNFTVPDGHRVTQLTFSGGATGLRGVHFEVAVLGTDFHRAAQGDQAYPPTPLNDPGTGSPYLKGATGQQQVAFWWKDCSEAVMQIEIATEPAPAAIEQWKSDVWNALFDAAQTQYYAQQQDYATRANALQEHLNSVDTLTLRREESDEVMKSVLRFLLGPGFDLMPAGVLAAVKRSGGDLAHGVAFTGNEEGGLGISAGDWAVVSAHEDLVRFVNQAIEWENVVTYLYSYFWDVPQSWDFIRDLRHPDADRQAFLRAGSARVVLTVRKGWEEAWVRFVEGGHQNAPIPDSHPYLTVAREIAAYDDRNYPGIPPANPARSAARLEDSIETSCAAAVDPVPGQPIDVPVASSSGFDVGGTVVVDVADSRGLQETATVTAIPDHGHLTLSGLSQRHDGTAVPFPIVRPGEKGALIAEWNEYTPTSGTDIAISSDLADVS